jgi:dUTPase
LTPPDDVLDDEDPEAQSLSEAIDEFVSYRLIFDDNGVPGIVTYAGDYLLFNSGIKVGLPTDTAGIFFNKSGKGNKGFDTRACVVDEDYAGFVHLSSAYDKETYFGENIYCGDKFSQMVVLPVVKTSISELDEAKYDELMSNSQRGADGFGSSDVKH